MSALAQFSNINHWTPFYVFRWLGYWTGISNESGKGYGFWSGIGSCLSYASLPLGMYRRHNCHRRWCWRMWHHEITGEDGITYKVCHRHRGRKRHFTAADLTETLRHHDAR